MKVTFTQLDAFLQELGLAAQQDAVEHGLVRRTFRYQSLPDLPAQSLKLIAGYVFVQYDGPELSRQLVEVEAHFGVLEKHDDEHNMQVQEKAGWAMAELERRCEEMGLQVRAGTFAED